MRRLFLVLTMVLYGSISFSNDLAGFYPIPEVDVTQLGKAQYVYALKRDENLNLEVGIISSLKLHKSSLIITYSNLSSDKSEQPDYKYCLYNKYGFKITEIQDKWFLDTVQKGETRVVEKTVDIPQEVRSMLEFTAFQKPSKWEEPAYVVIRGSTK